LFTVVVYIDNVITTFATIIIMNFVQALASADAIIDAIQADGLANGDTYFNTAMPGTSHVKAHNRWPMNVDGTARSLTDHICRYSSVHLDAAGMAAVAEKEDIETAVIVAVARGAAYRYYGWNAASLSPAERVTIAGGTGNLTVHADHEVAVAAAIVKWSPVAPRYMGLFFYNSISYETICHNHLPAVSKKLAKTTITLTGLADFIASNPARENAIFHDCFHVPTPTEKSNAARNVNARDHLSGIKFDNLRKRIPVKAPDSGIALNYTVLHKKAKAYHHASDHIPGTLAPPASLAAAVTAYEGAANAADLRVAVTTLRALSAELEEPSAYLAGFILGREANTTGDEDLDLRTAKRTTTILGSPAYARAAGEFSGTFAFGKKNGYAKVAATVASQVLPRCAAAVARAAAIGAAAPAAAPAAVP
jgi:hypothetical protein